MHNRKENTEGKNLSNLETDPFEVQWMVWRKDPEAQFGISLKSDETDHKEEMINLTNEGMAGEEVHCLSMFLSTSGCARRNGDVVVAASPQKYFEEIRRELRAATTTQMWMDGLEYCEAPD